ncbi:Trafficking protein particle complex subunit 10 [Labeo rohita]|uniref:Trafficking protein particle complex subunit 10 n=1 Tax=Labeo rohita TaxID=84645 RepID=A0ABQ8M850_LABRO|nr:Trafficking protein particle complex subunit 10 [Labeo rohita]
METHEEKPIIYTMENKPIVTCAGDQNLFTALSYGRAPKMIYLEANFVQFKEELLPKEGNKALLTFPFLHIYWTDCCSDNKKKNKTNILPRTSIVDKIRNDFCNKQSDRCVSLSDPLKESSRSQESWSSFLTKLRTLLLMSFTRNLGRFEDEMRTLREKRTEPGWSFCDYFMVQEELAFVFEMLQQFEDALVQYDELDALFTQYVLNFGAGDGANWLGSFCQPVRSWNGLLLRRPIDMEKRDLIQKGEASLLDLRSYLFSRQCTLLIFLQRPWEVSVVSGALDCWVFLSCLEVLHRIEGCCDRTQLEANSSHTVGLWTYATEKLKCLGDLCGLVSENGPNSEDLNKTVDLLAGLGAERPETANSPQSPYKKLKEALSSVEAFEKHYLELSHAAMEMYKAIGRLRSARLVGKSLAEFYMRKGDPQSAEDFLLDSLKSYVSESWSLPLTHTRKQIAEYLQTSALLASDTNLSDEERKHFCQEILTFASQTTEGKGQQKDGRVALSMSSFTQLQELRFRPASALVHVGAVLQLELRVCSLMPIPVRAEQLAASIHFTQEQPGTTAQKRAAQNPDGTVTFPAASPVAASPALELCEIQEHSPSDNALSSAGVACKNMHLLMRRHDSAASLDTPNAAPSAVAMEDGAQMLKASDVTLSPGNNSISQKPGTYTLRQLCATVGRVQFVLPHLYPVVQYEVYSQEPQLSIQPLTGECQCLRPVCVCVRGVSGSHLWSVVVSENLLAGLPQQVKFTILTGHYAVKKGDALQLSNTDSMPVLHSSTCGARILSSSAELLGESALSIQSSEKVTSISLPVTPPYHTLEFLLDVLCHIPSSPARMESERLTNGQISHRARSRTRFSSGMAVIDQKVSVDCPWSIYSTLVSLTFHVPFKVKHSLLSAGRRKFIQVCLQNVSDTNFRLTNQTLTENQHTPSLELLSLNTKTHSEVFSHQCVFSVWEVRWSGAPPVSLHCEFSAAFAPSDAPDAALKPYRYEFTLERVSTLYSVRAEIRPAAGEQHCRTGALCRLEVSLTRLTEPSDTERSDEEFSDTDGLRTTRLMYEVIDNNSNWAVCGKSSGVVSMPVAAMATHKVHMEVMPLFAGHLPFPNIRVFKYLPHHASPVIQPDTAIRFTRVMIVCLCSTDSCLENDSLSLLDKTLEDQADTASLRSRGSVQSLGSGESAQPRGPMPKRQAFGPGQVFNGTQGRQVLVLPAADHHVMEVNVT